MRPSVVAMLWSFALWAADPNPVIRVWRINPQAANPALRAVLPDVHSVRVDGDTVHVESAGLALQSMAPLDVNAVDPAVGVRKFDFAFPLAPKKAAKPPRTPYGVIGAFVNGVPIYPPTSAVSWRDQNLWHQDAIAPISARSPLVSAMLETRGQHSPLIGFALDGFPVYGPWGWDSERKVKRFRSSYRLRSITRRDILPEGTALGPSQEGPPVGPQYPLGTFVEDYEYAASGDLDEHNGRLTKTPEYPEGTYAYFLSTDVSGGLTYPYLIGSTYYGEVHLGSDFAGTPPLDGDPAIRMSRSADTLTFAVTDSQGRRVRFLERVHEKPIHLVIVSRDLKSFDHIHPELQANDTFVVENKFRAGKYWLYTDFTMPGKPQSISRFEVTVEGSSASPPTTQEGVKVTMRPPATIHAGEDVQFRFNIPVTDLEPYLGAWAHIMIVSEDGRRFIHAHPTDDGPVIEDPWKHTHAVPGPGPSQICTVTGFEKPGRYRMWVQVQRAGIVSAVPFDINVLPGKAAPISSVPTGAIRIRVSKAGFEPSRIQLPAGKAVTLAFERKDAENCASAVVFPDLSIQKDLPAGRTTLVSLPPLETGELTFSCGMRMYRGTVIAR